MLVQHNTNGWVFPTGDSSALAQCIKAAWQTPPGERILMGKRGQEIAASHSIAEMVERYEQLYERILSNS
jgi:glycosyltransferase involved in cell wall biosynthesis